MGIKKVLNVGPPKPVTAEQNREELLERGISVKNPNRTRKTKFAAYGQFARDKGQDRYYAPEGYEQYGRPPEPSGDGSEKGGIDDISNSEDKKKGKKSKRKSLFRRHKPSSSDEESSPQTSPVVKNGYDPYSVNYDSTGSESDIYKSFQSSSNDYGMNYDRSYKKGDYGTTSRYHARAGFSTDAMDYGVDQSVLKEESSPFSNEFSTTNPDSMRQSSNLGISYPSPIAGPSSTSNLNSKSPSSSPKTASPRAAAVRVSSPLNPNISQMDANPYASLNEYNNDYSSSSFQPTSPSKSSNPYSSMTNDSYLTKTTKAKPQHPRNSALQHPSSPKDRPLFRADTSLTADLNRSDSDLKLGAATSPSVKAEDHPGYNLPGRNSVMDKQDILYAQQNPVMIEDDLDLNETIKDYNVDYSDDLNADIIQNGQQLQTWQLQEEEQEGLNEQTSNNYDRGYKTFDEVQREEEERQQEEEEEAVDEIKQEIRFTKQSSVASTRNTLKMAQDAEMSGMNTLGVLGHQSEQLNNVERNLDLMKVQNTIADENIDQLRKYNRNILAVHVSNPFNSKKRKKEREELLRNRKIEEKIMMEQTAKNVNQSVNRIERAMNANSINASDVREKYEKQGILDRAKKYQFENDDEDDEMEVEIDRNLDKIQQVSGRLKKLAVAVGDELDSQQERLGNIENDTDDLDIKLHVNTHRLNGI
ncbi:hypothetical protein KAFR_0F03620 [Kazachstania africana CBS 2517]|uniref:t-SNARE coiled-coil homology domain-containing protein n=1 Tax=Kazachstania africana (strain ATCC 22294 / BCRC 22015 / CBS 2517 / CECT 1963 / NBRC 1671 / NRRL Y-8276) TaxID=1071382 RepID=H2AX58_KAZAF|nr:hypothetical protein KAFR_0F03620 [Kazachstania africana CBS 2517]CCF58958.1 hypothetical protein KAFR_0F03620 [Kazachstania africana CBS 2517]